MTPILFYHILYCSQSRVIGFGELREFVRASAVDPVLAVMAPLHSVPLHLLLDKVLVFRGQRSLAVHVVTLLFQTPVQVLLPLPSVLIFRLALASQILLLR